MVYRYFIKLSYNGSNFHGWQRQPNGITVQETLEDAMTLLLRRPIRLTGAGRTDTGVHASVYFAHFEVEECMSAVDLEKLVFKLNGFLTHDIAIHAIFQVQPGCHARFSAVSRTYKYYVARTRDPFRVGFSHFIYGPLDVEIMNSGAEILKNVEDFTSFSKVDTDTKTNICRVMHASWNQEGEELVFTIMADRFLRNMVRAIVGTLLQLGMGKTTLDEFTRIIESKNRSEAGQSAPACGLSLVQIEYPKECLPS